MKRPRFAVIPTRDRPLVLDRCIRAIAPQVDCIYIINNGYEFPDELLANWNVNTIVSMSKLQPPNLSMFWNEGINFCAGYATHTPVPWRVREIQDLVDMDHRMLTPHPATEWDVAILNDDAIVPEGWFDAVSDGMRAVSGAAGCSGPQSAVYTVPGPVPLHTRLTGYAFILAGELGLRANEDIHWYFTDDYIDWESRKLGGMVMVPGFRVDHLHPNGQMTPELNMQCAKDAQTFVDIYGMRPW